MLHEARLRLYPLAKRDPKIFAIKPGLHSNGPVDGPVTTDPAESAANAATTVHLLRCSGTIAIKDIKSIN
ncbi:uncharacterized protein AFUA_5G14345 [Aspergillus fumigatus Af293]|uniref:Uncharacterized protein n=2 Tax=Aspergillus fumigatus TaxID=746128 RepID=Q4WW42_ASPFU|nr:hypothetical protein AFUA_5G14345 [Aspergillus fumigatus Af293]EAL91184.2 hypothetical protein AFUA_5G14345 [Aspergillus fumigatus Af293]EDP52169.1 conserved hypothetical protein [Aspergillus fumigatus A1163]